MKPGIYTDLTDAQYRAIDACSQSALKLFSQSAKAVREAKEFPKHSSAFRLGRAADTLLFSPDRFATEFIEYAGSKKKNGEWTTERRGLGWAQFKEEAESAGKEVLTDDEANEARAICRACHQHPTAAGLLVGGTAQTVVVWVDQDTQLLCKAQLDYWQELDLRISDVKTTRSIAPDSWAIDSFKFGYEIQAAFYIDGIASQFLLRPEDITFTDIAIEKGSPRPDVVCYEVPQELIRYGRQQYRGWLEQYAECKESGKWPGICERGMLQTQVPAWAQDRVDGAL